MSSIYACKARSTTNYSNLSPLSNGSVSGGKRRTRSLSEYRACKIGLAVADYYCRQQKQQPGIKINTKRIREIFHYIESTIEVLCESFIEQIDNTPNSDAMRVKHIYIPEIIIAYISVVQSMAVFTSREITTKTMDIATVIADSERVWLQNVFMETGRMGELVDMLALTSKAMLTMVEDGGKSRRDGGKKRGSKGETNRIWDLNVRN